MSMFPAGLLTTLAVQKCEPSLPLELVNSAPTAALPSIGLPPRGSGWLEARAAGATTYAPIAVATRPAGQTARFMARRRARRHLDRWQLTPRRMQSSSQATRAAA